MVNLKWNNALYCHLWMIEAASVIMLIHIIDIVFPLLHVVFFKFIKNISCQLLAGPFAEHCSYHGLSKCFLMSHQLPSLVHFDVKGIFNVPCPPSSGWPLPCHPATLPSIILSKPLWPKYFNSWDIFWLRAMWKLHPDIFWLLLKCFWILLWILLIIGLGEQVITMLVSWVETWGFIPRRQRISFC